MSAKQSSNPISRKVIFCEMFESRNTIILLRRVMRKWQPDDTDSLEISKRRGEDR